MALASTLVLAALPSAGKAAGPLDGLRDVAAEAGVAEITHTYSATAHDFDGDGDEDITISRHYGGFPRIYGNDGDGTFTDLSDRFIDKPPPLEAERFGRDYHHCDWADVDGRNGQDMFCSVGGLAGGNGPNPSELWLRRADGRFAERAADWGVADPYGRGRAVAFIYANADDRPDLFVGNAYPRVDGKRGGNHLFLNRGDRFARAPWFGLNRVIGAHSAQAVDYDLDGREDLLLCSNRGLRLFRNEPGRFARVRLPAPRRCVSAAMAEMGRGRRPDLVSLHFGSLRVHFQDRRHRFRPRHARAVRVRRGRDLALADVLGAARPEIYVLRRGPQGRDRADLLFPGRHRMPLLGKGVGRAAEGLQDGFLVMNGHRQHAGPIALYRWSGR